MMPTRPRVAWCVPALLCALAACSQTNVTFLTTALVGATADVDVDARTLELSRGAAIAFECSEADFFADYFGPCRDFSVESDGDAVDVRRVHLEQLEDTRPPETHTATGGGVSLTAENERTGRVLVGRAAGAATLTISSLTGSAELEVQVLE
ncbi:MAG: hypothetical protein HYS27_24710 [Deltaproteobacteria bacterium]|nr:hypothetical protein [Deltaproteobacteria bacterium]